MKNTSWVWKEIRREKSAKIVLLAISFSFLVTILMFIVSGTFIKNVQKQTEDIYGYFDHILYHAEQNTDNLSFSQKKISKKLGSPVMRQSFPAFRAAFSVALIPPFWRCRRSGQSHPSSAHRCNGGRAGFGLAHPVPQWLPADFQAGGS